MVEGTHQIKDEFHFRIPQIPNFSLLLLKFCLSLYPTSNVPSYVLRIQWLRSPRGTVRCTQKLKLLSQSVYNVTEVNFVFRRLGNGDLVNKTSARIVFPRSGLVGHCPSTQVKSLLQIAPVSKVARVFLILHVNKHNIISLSY